MTGSDFYYNNSYNDVVKSSSTAMESMVILFAVVIVVSIVVSLTIFFVLRAKASKRFTNTLNRMVDNVKKEESKSDNVCAYCGEPIGEEKVCPNCGAKQKNE